MKTTSAIRFIALAAVLLASANVDASDACYQQGRALKPIPSGNTIQIILCLINLVTTGNISVSEVMKCMLTYQSLGSNSHYAHFVIKNGESVTDNGLIMNAELVWGKWKVHGSDVDTVNNMSFDQKKAATFTASGRDYALAGTEGFFEIHENGKIVAIVYFEIPFTGDNTLEIKQVDKGYLCDDEGFSSGGSPTIMITCHKIASGGA